MATPCALPDPCAAAPRPDGNSNLSVPGTGIIEKGGTGKPFAFSTAS